MNVINIKIDKEDSMKKKKKVKEKTVKTKKKTTKKKPVKPTAIVKKKKRKKKSIEVAKPAPVLSPLPKVTEKILSDYLFGTKTKLTDGQKIMFFQIAKINNLNPFKKEVYPVLYEEKNFGKSYNPPVFNLVVMTGYEVYLKRADRSGQLAGWNTSISGTGEDREAKIVIWRKDWNEPFTHFVTWKEFGKSTPIWKSIPDFMLKKVAISQGFRLAFPNECGDLPYISEEMKDVTPEGNVEIGPAPKQIESSKVEIKTPDKYTLPKDINPDTLCAVGPYKNKPKKYSDISLDRLLILHKKSENPEELTPALRHIVDNLILNACKLKGLEFAELKKLIQRKFKKDNLLDLKLDKKLVILKEVGKIKDKEKK